MKEDMICFLYGYEGQARRDATKISWVRKNTLYQN